MSIEHQNAEVHPLGETPKVTMESAEAEERDIKLQPDTSVNDPGLEKPIERNMEESELQGTMQYQLEKHDSFKKGMFMLTSCSMFPLYNIFLLYIYVSVFEQTLGTLLSSFCSSVQIKETREEATTFT